MDVQSLKALAKCLRTHIRQQHGISIQYGHALDLIAAVPGLRNWPEVIAFPEKVSVATWDAESAARLADRIESSRRGIETTGEQLLYRIGEMNADLPPIWSDFSTREEAQAHDAWFRSRVSTALSDTRPPVPHDLAMARIGQKQPIPFFGRNGRVRLGDSDEQHEIAQRALNACAIAFEQIRNIALDMKSAAQSEHSANAALLDKIYRLADASENIPEAIAQDRANYEWLERQDAELREALAQPLGVATAPVAK